MSSKNLDNRQKEDVYANKVWRPVRFHDGKDEFGQVKTTDGFKNLLTDQEVTGSEPPYATGEARGMIVTDAFRDGWERIWGSGSGDQASAS